MSNQELPPVTPEAEQALDAQILDMQHRADNAEAERLAQEAAEADRRTAEKAAEARRTTAEEAAKDWSTRKEAIKMGDQAYFDKLKGLDAPVASFRAAAG